MEGRLEWGPGITNLQKSSGEGQNGKPFLGGVSSKLGQGKAKGALAIPRKRS